MERDEILEMARQAGIESNEYDTYSELSLKAFVCVDYELVAFAKLVADKAIAKDRKEFDIDELCARQNKIGYKQGYRAGQLAEREACAKVCDELDSEVDKYPSACAAAIRARGEAC